MYVLMELGPRERGTKSRAITISLSPQCRGYNGALRNEQLLSPLFPIGGVGRGGRQWLQMSDA